MILCSEMLLEHQQHVVSASRTIAVISVLTPCSLRKLQTEFKFPKLVMRLLQLLWRPR